MPHDRIAEDYLRILRFFRFHAWYGDPRKGWMPRHWPPLRRNLDGLDHLSRERIGHEMRRLLAAPDPAPALAAMAATGTLARILPGADPRAIAPLVHLEGALTPRWLRRLAALGGAEPDLRLSRAESVALAQVRAALALPLPEAAWRLGAETATDAALITAATLGTSLPQDWQATIAAAAAAQFPVCAADLMPALHGAALGQALQALQSRWIASGFTLTRAALLAEPPASP
jgi:poly(A) polymerase